MDFLAVFTTFKKLLFSIPLNFFDSILIVAFLFYVYEEASLGALPALTNLVAIITSFMGGLLLYQYLSTVITALFSVSKGIADAVSFLVVCSVIFLITTNLISFFTRKSSLIFPNKYSKVAGGFFGAISFFLLAAFVVSILLSFPVSTVIKSQIKNSLSGKFLFTKTLSLEYATHKIFGVAISDTLNFLTIKPDTDTTVTLHFKTNNGTVDAPSEKKMLALINTERRKRKIALLQLDKTLTGTARTHAKDMLMRGYFSHYTPEGLSPFDRLEKDAIPYLLAAENLAFAPEVELAVSGLMKSEGHKRNILDSSFHKVGIGIIDAGMYGKMFVQEFTD